MELFSPHAAHHYCFSTNPTAGIGVHHMPSGKKFRIGTSLAELAVVRASRMKIIHVVTVIDTTFPVTDKVIYTFIYYYLMENRPYI